MKPPATYPIALNTDRTAFVIPATTPVACSKSTSSKDFFKFFHVSLFKNLMINGIAIRAASLPNVTPGILPSVWSALVYCSVCFLEVLIIQYPYRTRSSGLLDPPHSFGYWESRQKLSF